MAVILINEICLFLEESTSMGIKLHRTCQFQSWICLSLKLSGPRHAQSRCNHQRRSDSTTSLMGHT
jgi:hypothetical protein